MSQITEQNLTFCYDGSYDNIFEEVSFTLDTDWKLGFTGRNGRGKTTFLKLLMGEFPYSGNISASVHFDYFPYEISDYERDTLAILEEIAPEAQLWEFGRELSLLDVDEGVLYRPFSTLSNGERTKAMLAACFCKENNFLLIDEPTNHLDTDGRRILGDYLKGKSGFILVSHDRVFLDRCVDHILSINKTNIEIQKGNFSTWWQNKQDQDNLEMAQNERLQKDIRRLGEAARRTSDWSDKVEKSKKKPLDSGLSPERGHIGRMAAKMMKRSKSIQGRQESAIDEKAKLLKNIETADALKLYPAQYHAPRVVTFDKVSISYGEHAVCQDLSFTVERGDRVLLRGKNGSGKSSVLGLVAGKGVPYSGTVQLGSGAVLSLVPQDTSWLKGDLRGWADGSGIDLSLFLAILRKLDFERVQFEKDMADYSAGQKKKVLLARSLCERAHLYLWDEPLNYIDVFSRMQIEQLILEYRPTMLLVEHDEAFSQKVATKVVSL